ncbi:hypothetical protein L3Q82_000697 [Scortum barcoo]|uniref:Uncharacterized protein n=1 Tax=Scortum barcoo TaxID=214431 RepID=A0ACB8WD25_9TELE|nr:hypothetical protein L3Q82_000697 [Scortum barcoo]
MDFVVDWCELNHLPSQCKQVNASKTKEMVIDKEMIFSMAQSGSCPNPDLPNGAIVHSPLGIFSDLDTQRGREEEGGEEEEEEVELAEEVGEDVSVMVEAGEGQATGKSREDSEMEEVSITQISLLPNEVLVEEKGGGEQQMENEDGVEVGNEHELIDEQTGGKVGEGKGEEESKNKTSKQENSYHSSALLEVEEGQEQILDDGENKKEAVIASLETEVREDKIYGEHDLVEEHQALSTTDDAGILAEESGEGTPLSLDGTDKTEVVTLSTNGKITLSVEDPIIDVCPTGINEQVSSQDNVCQTSTVGMSGTPFDTVDTIKVVASQTNQLTSENKDEVKNTDKDKDKDKSEPCIQVVKSVNIITWQQIDYIEAKDENEGTQEFVKYAIFNSDDVLETGGKVNQKVEQPDLVSGCFKGTVTITD